MLSVALLAALVAVAQRQRGLESLANRLSNGSAWLLARNGTVELVDGLSGRAVTRLPATNVPSDDLHVVQHGPDAFVVNRTQGTVMRLDGRALRNEPPVEFSGVGLDLQLDVFVAGDSLAWVTSGSRDLVYPVDPATLDQRGENLALSTEATATAVTPDGTLFVLDAPAGVLDVFTAAGGVQRRVLEGFGPESALSVVDGDAVIVDPTQGRLFRLRADGTMGRSSCFAIPSGMVQLGSPSPASVWLPAVGADRRLYAADLSRSDCPTPIVLDGAAGPGRYGAPVEKDRLVYVQDFATGEVVIVDVGQPRPTVTRSGVIIPAGGDFDLFIDDGLLWVDDRAGDVAGVLLADLSVRNIQKFDPNGTGGGAVAGTIPEAVEPGDVPNGGSGDQPSPTPTRPPASETPDEPDPVEEEDPGVSIPGAVIPPDVDPPTVDPPTVDPPPGALQADFQPPPSVIVGQEATFISNSLGSPTEYEWSVDGQRRGANSGLFRYTFPTTGSAVVGLTVKDAAGRSSTTSRSVTISADDVKVFVTVPNLVGLARGAATQRLLDLGLRAGKVDTQESKRPKDEVLSQRPAGGQRVETGTAVDFVISSGGGPFTLPDVTGKLCADAEGELTGLGLKVAVTRFPLQEPAVRYYPPVAELVVQTGRLAGSTMNPGDPIQLDCKLAPGVPDLRGQSAEAARALIGERLGRGVSVTITTRTDASRPASEVLETFPAPGTPIDIDRATIELIVASGPPAPVNVIVPDVCGNGLDRAMAESRLRDAGLTVGNSSAEFHDTAPPGTVIRTAPACGASVPPRTVVDLVTSRGPQPCAVADYRGSTLDAVKADLAAKGLLYVDGGREQSDATAPGLVLRTDPAAGQPVPCRGGTVSVVLADAVVAPPQASVALSCDASTRRCSAAVANGVATNYRWTITLGRYTSTPTSTTDASGAGNIVARVGETTESTDTPGSTIGIGQYRAGSVGDDGVITYVQRDDTFTLSVTVSLQGGGSVSDSTTSTMPSCY
ncbi:MAG: PASTA domain-containing protein [Acidimicrobiales bacterium]|nr:PASTA domain-containing protein [Acidimicrobiales bacterium]